MKQNGKALQCESYAPVNAWRCTRLFVISPTARYA